MLILCCSGGAGRSSSVTDMYIRFCKISHSFLDVQFFNLITERKQVNNIKYYRKEVDNKKY